MSNKVIFFQIKKTKKYSTKKIIILTAKCISFLTKNGTHSIVKQKDNDQFAQLVNFHYSHADVSIKLSDKRLNRSFSFLNNYNTIN